MKKIIILMPVYNDWESLIKVLDEINSVIQNIKNYEFRCVIVNDSSSVEKPKIIKPKNFNSLKIINMKANRGHARCNAFGLRYINSNEKCDYVIIMDSDGEDRPVEINALINNRVDYLVLEAGLGGEFDATNVVPNDISLKGLSKMGSHTDRTDDSS